jgi:hypothetical protein
MDKNKINELYKSGLSIKKIGELLGHCQKTVGKVLNEMGTPREYRDNGRRKFKLNDTYFENIDTPLKAYFLGLMYADGFCLQDGYTSGINIVKDDKILLEKFAEETFGSKDVVYDIKKAKINSRHQSRLIFKSREFQKHLISQGVFHQKSLILTPPEKIPENLVKFFILGYFDGDGCFSGQTFSIVSTKSVCEWIGEHFIKNGVIEKYTLANTQNGITHRLIIFNKRNVSGIYNYFYQNPPPICLDRKRIKMFDHLVKTFAVKPDKIYVFHQNGFILRDELKISNSN